MCKIFTLLSFFNNEMYHKTYLGNIGRVHSSKGHSERRLHLQQTLDNKRFEFSQFLFFHFPCIAQQRVFSAPEAQRRVFRG